MSLDRPARTLARMDAARGGRVIAVLGPTNTGKTHYAIDRMLAHRTGVIGLPLRLLAREVYDRIVASRGPSVVALVTGEERIVPPRAAFWVCTVEAMPVDLGPEFLAVDEIQLCADPDRGHVFTDRLLRARGLSETLFLGSDTMRARIASLIPGAQFLHRERFSQLSYTGVRKISRMPARSAIVGFSVDDVYAIAELIRRQKGGAAVVMGALSPRTRNAQVALYENGDVDHLVATDAIGMGLNLDIGHVAFAGLTKFDGRRHRQLAPNELAQIGGRAGRFTTPGTFGVTGEAPALEPDVAEAIENHRFAPIRRLQWRNARLEFGTCEALIASLEAPPDDADLQRAREADDLATLRALHDLPDVARSLRGGPDVRLLWDVCQLPDFRKVALDEHARLCARLFGFLREGGHIPTDWLARQIQRIDRTDGEIDTLSKRLAYIRTWTYVAQRKGWIEDGDHWREETRALEDRLSDALHLRLTQRFVDRRTSVLMRRLKEKETLVAHVSATDEVTVEDQFIGRLEGFRFRLDPSADAAAVKTLRAAGLAALAPALSLRSDKFYNAPDTEIDVTEQGGLMWGEHAVGKLAPGTDALSPQIVPFVDEDAAPEIAEKVRRRLGHWVERKTSTLFQPLIALRDDETLTGMARGIGYRLVEALGVLPRAEVASDVKGLDQDQRAGLRKHGVRFGQYTLFLPLLLKPAPTRLRLVLWSLAEGLEVFPESPPPGLVTMPAVPHAPAGYYQRAGYRLAGERAIRIDMLERLADMVRAADTRGGFEATPEMLSITGLSLEQFARLMQGLGYQAAQGTREKRRPQPVEKSEPARRAPRLSQAADPSLPTQPNPPPAPQPDAPQPDAPLPDAPQPGPAPTPPQPDVPREPPADPPAPPGPDTPPVELPGGPPGEAPPDAPVEVPLDAPGEQPSDVPVEMPPGPAETPPDVPIDLPPQVAQADAAPDLAPGDTAKFPSDPDAAATPVETEIFFTFVRAPRPRVERARPVRPTQGDPARDRPVSGPRPAKEGGKPSRAAKPKRPNAPPPNRPAATEPARLHARPPRTERPVDPDNPFAALMALKTRN